MKKIERVIPDNANIFLFGDKHDGSVLSCDNLWDKLVNDIHSKYEGVKANFAVDHSDMIEAIVIDDKRFEFATTKEVSIVGQAQMAIQRRVSIKKNLICGLKGNHEHALSRFGDMAKFICDELGVEYGTYSAIIEYKGKDGKTMFKHYATHGAGSVKSSADDPVRVLSNMKLAIKRKMKNKFGDTLLNSMGHTHQLLVLPPEPTLYLTHENGGVHQNYTEPKKTTGYIEPNHKWYVNTGSFLKLFGDGVDGYAERFQLDPVELGFAVAMIRDRKLVKIKRERL